jgi:hypothetical protein
MNMPTPQFTQPLADVFYQLSLDERGISAEVVDEYVRSHPGYADELTDFAIALAIEELRGGREADVVEPVIDHARQSAMVSVAISRFHNRLYNAGHAGTLDKPAVPAQPAETANPFLPLDRAAFRQFVKQLDVSTAFACKLRDRLIDPFTIPRAFVVLVSKLLGVTPESLLAHFAGPMVIGATAQHYKADGKPSIGKSESFPDAVRNSGLTDAQQQRLLTL